MITTPIENHVLWNALNAAMNDLEQGTYKALDPMTHKIREVTVTAHMGIEEGHHTEMVLNSYRQMIERAVTMLALVGKAEGTSMLSLEMFEILEVYFEQASGQEVFRNTH
jgi:hypothetical protein